MVEPCFPCTFYPSFMPQICSGGYSSSNLNHFLACCELCLLQKLCNHFYSANTLHKAGFEPKLDFVNYFFVIILSKGNDTIIVKHHFWFFLADSKRQELPIKTFYTIFWNASWPKFKNIKVTVKLGMNFSDHLFIIFLFENIKTKSRVQVQP